MYFLHLTQSREQRRCAKWKPEGHWIHLREIMSELCAASISQSTLTSLMLSRVRSMGGQAQALWSGQGQDGHPAWARSAATACSLRSAEASPAVVPTCVSSSEALPWLMAPCFCVHCFLFQILLLPVDPRSQARSVLTLCIPARLFT